MGSVRINWSRDANLTRQIFSSIGNARFFFLPGILSTRRTGYRAAARQRAVWMFHHLTQITPLVFRVS
jgi:hypothetical protein